MTDYTNLRKIVTGDIIIKCRLGNEIRRIPINQVPTYDELCLMMYRVFKFKISNPDNIILKYMDNEGDMISLLDDIDITHAISISSLLKITVYDKSSITTSISQLDTSLTEARDQLNHLIEYLKTIEITQDVKDVIKEESKPTRKLTPDEIAKFLSNNDHATKNSETEKNSPAKEVSPASNSIPYYPPPQPQTNKQPSSQQQPAQQQHSAQQHQYTVQQQQQNSVQHQHTIQQHVSQQQQKQPVQQQQPAQQQQPIQQQPLQQQQQPAQQQPLQQQQQQQPAQQQHYIQPPPNNIPPTPTSQQRPLSMQAPTPSTNPPYQQYNTPNYPPPPTDPRLQPRQQAYFVPPPPTSMTPPQPYNRW